MLKGGAMSKMKKIYILGVMCLVILFTALLDVPKGTVEKVSANEPIINEGNVSRTAQLLGDANETIYRTFTATQKGEWIYPEDFGGTWVKNEKLYLALARNDHDTIEKYTTILSGHEDGFHHSQSAVSGHLFHQGCSGYSGT